MAAQGNSRPASDRPWLLAIDTATPQAGVAVTDGEQLGIVSWPGGRQQTTSVPSAVTGLLDRCGIDFDRVGAVAVSIGPGSFTGLRVGLSLAKGMAIAPPRAVLGIPTLSAVADPFLALQMPVVPVIPAGRGRVVWSHQDGETLTDPVNSAFVDFVDAVQALPGALVAGELAADQRIVLETRGIKLVPASLVSQRVASIATLGYRRWVAGDVDDPATLEPVYLHGRPNPR